MCITAKNAVHIQMAKSVQSVQIRKEIIGRSWLWKYERPGSIRKDRQIDGVYHVLHGAISPMAGVGPDDIRLSELMVRLQKDVDEVIVATNKNLEGDTTATYISKLVKPLGIKVSRIASGVPAGGDLEYIDEVTLYRALEGRTDM